MAAVEAPVLQESVAAKILRVLGKTPVHLFLAAVGLLWLVPTIGLLVTSILPASNFDAQGWWKVFSKPSLATWSNYDEIFKNHQITHALVTTLEIAIGGTVLPIFVAALAGYAFAWLEFPGRDWFFVGVIALAMWRTAFTEQKFGLGAAAAVFLFVLVLPVLALNIRRFRREI